MVYLGVIALIFIAIIIFIGLLISKQIKVFKILDKKMKIQMDSVMGNKDCKEKVLKTHSTAFLYGYIYRLFIIYRKKEFLNSFEESLVKKLFISILSHKDYFDEKLAKGHIDLLLKALDFEDKKTMTYFDFGNTYAELFEKDSCLSNNWKSYLLKKDF